MVSNVQSGGDLVLGRHQLQQCGVYRFPANIGELDQNTAPIIGVILSRDESSFDEPVDPIRHRSRCDQSFSEQLSR